MVFNKLTCAAQNITVQKPIGNNYYGTKMSSPVLLYQATVFLQFAVSSLTQFLPPSMFQQQPSMQASMSPISAPMMMPSPMQIPFPYPQQRLPVMMMPFHSRAADKKYMTRKKRRPKYYVDSDSSSESESCSSNEYLRTHDKGKKKRQVLTPVISYVTRNGRVVYQKKIKKENAGDWLEVGGKKLIEDEKTSGDMTIHELKHKYGLKRHHY